MLKEGLKDKARIKVGKKYFFDDLSEASFSDKPKEVNHYT